MLELTKKLNVESFIGNNIETLEEVLNQSAKKYLVARKEKKKYDFGSNFTPDILKKLSREVIRDTNNFLNITEVYPVQFSMFYLPNDLKRGAYIGLGVAAVATLVGLCDGLTVRDLEQAGLIALNFGLGSVLYSKSQHGGSVFDKSEKVIRIGAKKEVSAVGDIAHEYTHNLQDSVTDLPFKGKNPIIEGHARGVEGVISNIFAQRYDNPAYAFEHLRVSSRELKDAYLFICNKNGINPKESLANSTIPNVRGRLYSFFGHHYSIGVAAMSIAEAQHGSNVYRDVMKNDYSFLKV